VQLVLAGPADAPTSRAIAHLDALGAATYRFELNWDVRDVRLAENSAGLHVGLLGMVLAPGAEQVRRLVEAVSSAGDVVISYDPNVQASVTPDGRGSAVIAGRMAALAHIVKMSDEDLAFLFPQPAGRARRCRPAVNANAGGVRNVRWGRAAPDRRSGNGRRGADLCAPGGRPADHAGAPAFPGGPAFVRLTAARLRRGGITDG
jgi:fructokinase